MPLVRIDLDRSAPIERAAIVGDIVYEAMITVANVPKDDKFQVIARHDSAEIVFPANGYLGIRYSRDLVIIQITANNTRTLEQKKAFFKRTVDLLAENPGIRREDVFISLVEVGKENWSFGNGEAQYVTAAAVAK